MKMRKVFFKGIRWKNTLSSTPNFCPITWNLKTSFTFTFLLFYSLIIDYNVKRNETVKHIGSPSPKCAFYPVWIFPKNNVFHKKCQKPEKEVREVKHTFGALWRMKVHTWKIITIEYQQLTRLVNVKDVFHFQGMGWNREIRINQSVTKEEIIQLLDFFQDIM